MGLLLLCAGGSIALAGMSPDPWLEPQRIARVGTAIVSGRIVDAVDGYPVPFARVEMKIGTSVVGSERGEARADEHGVFAVERLTAGHYFLVAMKPGYAATHFATAGSTTLPPGDPINVGDAERVKPVEIRLVRGGVISGRVTDQFGQPAARAVLHLRQTIGLGGPSPFFVLQESGDFRARANGDYRLFGLPEGGYVVSAQVQESGPELRLASTEAPRIAHARVFFPGTTDVDEARTVMVRPGEERTGIDIQLKLEPLLTVTGTLSIPGNVNASQIRMTFEPVSGDPNRSYVSTRANGRFEAQNVSPNRYWLTAFAYEQGLSATQPGPLVWGALQVTIVDRDLRDLALALQPSATVEGIFADVPATEMSKYNVIAVPISRVVDAPARPGRPDSLGMFLIRDLTPGRYRLRVGFGPNWNTEITGAMATIAGELLRNREIEIAAGATVTGLVIRVPK